jgi:hypothetical protein
MSLSSINIFYILNLLGKMPTKIWFIREVHNKMQIDKNIERVQDKPQDQNKTKTILKWNLIYDEL